jgi:tetratricopeptide (TPR) repeat protein
VAYAGLLGDRRSDLHAAVMAAIERLHADRLVEHVERLAHHARQGEVWDKAARYLRQAGAKVFLRSANREAAVYLEQALDALRRLPEHPDAIAESLDIRFDLRNALNVLGESGRIGALLDEAQALAEAVGDERRLGRALNYKVIQLGRAGDLAAAIQTGLRALAIGESQADVAIQVVANLNLGQVYVAWGECREAVRHCEAAVAADPGGPGAGAIRSGRHPGLDRAVLSCYRARGARAVRRGVRASPRGAAHCGGGGARLHACLPPLQPRLPRARSGRLRWRPCPAGTRPRALPDERGSLAAPPLRRGAGRGVPRDRPLRRGGRPDGGRRPWPRREDSRVGGVARPRLGTGGAYLLDGRLADATRIAQDGLAAARQRGERGVEGHVLRLLGDIAAHPDRVEVDTAEAHYRQALALAEALGTLLFSCYRFRPFESSCWSRPARQPRPLDSAPGESHPLLSMRYGAASSSSRVFACWRSAVSNPSVNRP